MRKHNLCRAELLQIEELKKHPDKLQVWIEKGELQGTANGKLSFLYSYQMNILITEYAGDPNAPFVRVCRFLQRYQPDLSLKKVAFEVEPLDHARVDLMITISDIEERVLVDDDDNIFVCPEPDYAAYPDGHPLAGLTSPGKPWPADSEE